MNSILKFSAVLRMGLSVTGSAFAQSKGLPSEEAPTPVPAVGPAAAPDSVQQELKACVEDLATAKANSSEFLKRAEACEGKVESYCVSHPDASICNKSKPPTKKPPVHKPPKPTTCEMPDGQIVPPVDGVCQCQDAAHLGTPGHVAVRGVHSAVEQVCVLRRVKAIPDLTLRVESLEGNYADLKARLDALQTLTGQQFTVVFNQISEIVTELQDHERRLGELEKWRKEQAARDAGQDDAIAKAQADATDAKKNRSVQLVRVTGLAEVGYVGDAGANFALGGRLEYENRFTADSIASFYAGVGATVAPVHQDNTFGTIYMPFVDAGVRIHTDKSHAFGIDLGATYQVRLDGHPAGWMGKPSQYDGSNIGPSVGFMWNFHRHMHLMGRGTLGFGPENHLDKASNSVALEYPVQPRFFLGFGGTIGL